MKSLLFEILVTTVLLAQSAKPQPLGLGGDKLYDSTAEYVAQNPKCFLPGENLPSNYKVSRYRNNLGEDNFDCQVTSVRDDRFQLLGFPVRKRSTVISSDHVVAIFYDLRREDFSAVESALRERLGGPTEEEIDGYAGHDGCKGKEIHWRNEVSDIVLIDECERDKYGATAINLFYTRRPLSSAEESPR